MSGLIYLFTLYTDENCSYYGNKSQVENIKDFLSVMSYLVTLSCSFDSGAKFTSVMVRRGVLPSCATCLPNSALFYSVRQSP